MTEQTDPAALGLPHREPFIFIEKVLALEQGHAATCSKTFGKDEPFFRGHFPGDPIVPGVILAESLAQTAGIAAGERGKRFRLTAIKQMKFFEPVRPGSLVFFQATKSAEMAGLLQFQVSARSEERTVAQGEIVLSEL